jgi:hypothetical protein
MSPATARALLLALASLALPLLALGLDAPRDATTRCALSGEGAATATAGDCIRCHGDDRHGSHPVDVDYAAAARRRPADRSALRSLSELDRGGVRLDGGMVTCLSCHDARAGNELHLAIPTDLGGSIPPGELPEIRSSATRTATLQRATALCRLCHVVGEPPPRVAYK